MPARSPGTPEERAARRRQRVQAYSTRYRATHREAIAAQQKQRRTTLTPEERATRHAYQRAYYRRHHATMTAKNRVYNAQYRVTHREALARYAKAYREAHAERYRQASHRIVDQLTDTYITACLFGQRVGTVSPELIAAKRAIVRVKRLIQGREPGG